MSILRSRALKAAASVRDYPEMDHYPANYFFGSRNGDILCLAQRYLLGHFMG